MELNACRTLILNADFRPISYRPISSLGWQDAMILYMRNQTRIAHGLSPIITLVDFYDQEIHSQTLTYKIPSVVALISMHNHLGLLKLSRMNILVRDEFTCQYSGKKYPKSELTIDHVIPSSRGGKNSWLNLVTCHKDINSTKSNKTPDEAGLHLLRKPYCPSTLELREKFPKLPIPKVPKSWRPYIGACN